LLTLTIPSRFHSNKRKEKIKENEEKVGKKIKQIQSIEIAFSRRGWNEGDDCDDDRCTKEPINGEMKCV